MAKGIRMADIAKELGVSTVTVSKALGNQKGVSEELRERIKQLAEEMGYKAVGNKSSEEQKSYNIGVLVAATYIEKYVTFYWEFYQALTREAAKLNCFVMLEVLEKKEEKEKQDIKLIKEGKINGLIILGSMKTDYLKHLEENVQLPLLFMDFYDAHVKEDCIISNSFYGTYYLTNYLFEKGHSDIAFVGTVLATDSITDRYLGYRKSLMEHGVEEKSQWMIPDREESRYCYEQITLPEELPTAFVCNCDLTASKVVKALKERGKRVPEDVSVVGYDDYLYPGLCDVELTSYSVDMKRMARTGIETMVKKISGAPYQTGIQVIEGRLVERASVKKYGEEPEENDTSKIL